MALALIPFSWRWHATLFKAIGITIALAALPILVVSLDFYWAMMFSYSQMLTYDHSVSYGMSVMGWLQAWFGRALAIQIPKTPVFIAGLVLLISPALHVWWTRVRAQGLCGKWWGEGLPASSSFRALWLSSLTIWMVIFNHKAESPTFIIALSGILLAYLHGPRTRWDRVLLIACWILSSWSPTDLFPSTLRKEWVEPFQLKVFPYILYWLRVVWLMWTTTRKDAWSLSTQDLP